MWLALSWLAGGGSACGGGEVPRRDCMARVWVAAGEPDDVRIIGSWNGWQLPGILPEPQPDGWRRMRLALPPGDHGYLLSDARGVRRDPHAGLTTFDPTAPVLRLGGKSDPRQGEVSLLSVPDCAAPSLSLTRIARDGDRAIIEAQFLAAAASGSALDVASVSGATLAHADPASGRLALVADGLGEGRAHLWLSASDEEGAAATAEVVMWPEPRDPRDAIVYQVMIDRFRGDGGAALSPPATPGARAGGTLDGVRASLPAITALGADTLWLSPVYRNPSDAREGNDGRLYEGYHGYWALDSRAVDERIGGDAALEALVDGAHAAGVAVLLDVVPNHVYEDNPRFAAHRDWFGEPGCVCGTPSCPWAGNIERCWFAPYLPDVDWQVPETMEVTLDDARFWSERFDVDGVRIDAVPMMPRAVSRRIAHALRDTRHGDAPLVLGEVFTGPGAGAVDQLAGYLGPAGLDAVFDFPLMWALHEVVARGSGSFASVEAVLAHQEATLAEGDVMARILDNHDTPRFVSVAHGDAGGDPWDAPAAQPEAEEPYRRLMLGLGVLFTLPGMVVLYQGDELGLAGAGDPDNRRVMPDTPSPIQAEVKALAERLGQLRRCSTALRRGPRLPLVVGSDRYAYLRDGDHPVVVLLSTAGAPIELTLPAVDGPWRDVLSGDDIGEAITLAPLSLRVLLRPDDPCG